jgi:nicotinate phosphoribosyltransferase
MSAHGRLEGVAKKSTDKPSIGGRKWALRRRSAGGIAECEVIGIGQMPVDDGDDRELLVPLVVNGEVVGREPLAAARDRHVAARAELPIVARQLSKGEPAIATRFLGDPRTGDAPPIRSTTVEDQR